MRPYLLSLLWLWSVQASAQAPDPPPISVRTVVALALEAARHTAPGRADELAKRARLAGLVPQLRLAARRGLQQDQSSTSTLSDDRTNASLGDDLTLEAGLTFQLDRLVFAPEQVRLLAVERWLASDRRKLIEDVVHLFFKREKLLAERKEAAEANPALEADIAELEALLDAFTQGEFGKLLAAHAAKQKAAAKHETPPTAAPSVSGSPSPPAPESR